MYEAYSNSYPTSFGNVLHMKGASAAGEESCLLAGVVRAVHMRRFSFAPEEMSLMRHGQRGRRSIPLLINPQRKMLGLHRRLARHTVLGLATGLPLNLSHG